MLPQHEQDRHFPFLCHYDGSAVHPPECLSAELQHSIKAQSFQTLLDHTETDFTWLCVAGPFAKALLLLLLLWLLWWWLSFFSKTQQTSVYDPYFWIPPALDAVCFTSSLRQRLTDSLLQSSVLYLFVVIAMRRPAWLKLIPKNCFACPLWDHQYELLYCASGVSYSLLEHVSHFECFYVATWIKWDTVVQESNLWDCRNDSWIILL